VKVAAPPAASPQERTRAFAAAINSADLGAATHCSFNIGLSLVAGFAAVALGHWLGGAV
jgi:hypothetical protein